MFLRRAFPKAPDGVPLSALQGVGPGRKDVARTQAFCLRESTATDRSWDSPGPIQGAPAALGQPCRPPCRGGVSALRSLTASAPSPVPSSPRSSASRPRHGFPPVRTQVRPAGGDQSREAPGGREAPTRPFSAACPFTPPEDAPSMLQRYLNTAWCLPGEQSHGVFHLQLLVCTENTGRLKPWTGPSPAEHSAANLHGAGRGSSWGRGGAGRARLPEGTANRPVAGADARSLQLTLQDLPVAARVSPLARLPDHAKGGTFVLNYFSGFKCDWNTVSRFTVRTAGLM